MTTLLKHCCRFVALLLALTSGDALAHKASDAYLQLQVSPDAASLRIDVALRDLDVALDLDADGDGLLTWQEVRAAWPSIENYLRSNVSVSACDLPSASRSLERRIDGAYAALTLSGICKASSNHAIRYTVLRDVDPTHRGLAHIQTAGQGAVLKVLDPAKDLRGPDAAHDSVLTTSPATADPELHPAYRAAAHTSGEASIPFLREGIHHILTGYDHVLFLLCLLLPSVMCRTPQGWRPVDRMREALIPIIGIVTAFTVAHSITLGLAAMQWVSLSPAFIEPAIAVTIVLAAVDNVRSIFGERRAWVTFFFGLIHGFGFAGVLSELNLPATEFTWALLQFNLGIELGQLMIVATAIALLFVVRARPGYPGWVIRGGSCAAMFVGLMWFIERIVNVSLLPL